MAFDILKANLDLQATVSVFNDSDANAETVAAAGEVFLHTLYEGRKNDVTANGHTFKTNNRRTHCFTSRSMETTL